METPVWCLNSRWRRGAQVEFEGQIADRERCTGLDHSHDPFYALIQNRGPQWESQGDARTWPAHLGGNWVCPTSSFQGGMRITSTRCQCAHTASSGESL